MSEINGLIHDAFDVIGLILVFAFVLFDVRYPQITRMIEKDIPPAERVKDRVHHRDELRRTLLLGGVPLVIIYAFLIYLFLPLAWQVLITSSVHLLKFDFLRTAFIAVFGLLGVFLVWSAYLTYRIIQRLQKSKP